jgi:hypothetical protein
MPQNGPAKVVLRHHRARHPASFCGRRDGEDRSVGGGQAVAERRELGRESGRET